jgi:hypothetical protein
VRCRREHLAGLLLLAWSGTARAADEDVAVSKASQDLYECASGACVDVTHRTTEDPDPECVAAALGATALAGCACFGAVVSKSPPTPDTFPPGMLDACAHANRR